MAEVSKHPNDPNVWGLKNLSDEKWVLTDSKGTLKDILQGQNCRLENGVKIQFGNSDGEIRY